MTDISRAALFGKLNRIAYQSIESATVFCKLRGNPEVELAHWLQQLLQLQDGDLQRIVRHVGLDEGRLAKDLLAALERLPRSAQAALDFSATVEESVERAWVYSSLRFGRSRIRTADLLIAILHTRSLRSALFAISDEFRKIRVEALTDELSAVIAGSPEDALQGHQDDPAAAIDGSQMPGSLQAPVAGDALARFTVDLTAQARAGKVDPVVGREDEIRQVIDVLMRRRQNNPILVGEAGVGKTAVVEGFAQRIADGDVPPSLREVELRTLDVGLLQAGASMKGEFESRLRQVIDEVQASPRPVILFIDEAHTLVGAGGAEGTGDAANLLKPALARGTLRTVAATTWSEYKKHIEKDPALTRRFQTVMVDEPDESTGVRMLRAVASVMEQHHQVQILDEALQAAVSLSHRYIPARQLPDKAISLLDTACARVAISQHAVPPAIEDMRKLIEGLQTELDITRREAAIGREVSKREHDVIARIEAAQASLAVQQQAWEDERDVVRKILALRAQLREQSGWTESDPEDSATTLQPSGIEEDGGRVVTEEMSEPARSAALAELKQLQAELDAMQGEHPMILPTVDHVAVGAVVADWTGIPVGRMLRSELETVMNLPQILSQRVLGQDHAMEAIARRVQTARAGLDNPDKPIGVFLLAGTSGVGKTETALALAEALYGGEGNLITINMSEFQEAHSVSTLKGAPPGYVGYGEGGVLTEAVRRKPYSVVLLDEVEKAHPDVHEIFFQVFDKGVMEDGEGREIDFRNTLILLTSNVGSELISSLCVDPGLMPDIDALNKALRQPLLKVFPPALLGRLVTIPYFPLSSAMLADIVKLQLDRIRTRVQQRYQIPFEYDQSVVDLVVDRCTETESGGRMIDAILTNTMLPEISRSFLSGAIDGQSPAMVQVSASDGGFIYQLAAVPSDAEAFPATRDASNPDEHTLETVRE